MTRSQAIERGARDGERAADAVADERGVGAIRRLIATGATWDDVAESAGAAARAGVPPAHREAYYDAYQTAAHCRAEEIDEESD